MHAHGLTGAPDVLDHHHLVPVSPKARFVYCRHADLRVVFWWLAPRKIFEDPHIFQLQLLTKLDLAPAAPN